MSCGINFQILMLVKRKIGRGGNRRVSNPVKLDELPQIKNSTSCFFIFSQEVLSFLVFFFGVSSDFRVFFYETIGPFVIFFFSSCLSYWLDEFRSCLGAMSPMKGCATKQTINVGTAIYPLHYHSLLPEFNYQVQLWIRII
jgi:hypothetical protein